MKKLLLSCMMLLTMGGASFADEIKSYEPDEALTSVNVGDIFAIYNAADNKFLFGKDAQNLGYDVADKAFVSTNSGWLFKVNEEHDGHYTLLLQKPNGGDYDIWGNPGYLNSQPATGGCSFILGLNNQWGQDGVNLALWDFEAVTGGFKLKNIGTGLYLNSNAPAKFSEEEAAIWTFCTLKESSIENPISAGAYDATDANTAFFADFGPIAADATYDAETKVFTKNCGWKWEGEGIDLSHYRYIVITAGSSRDYAGAGYMYIKDASGKQIGGDDYGEEYQNLWFSTWNHLFCCKIDLEKLRAEKMFDIYHVTELGIDGGNYFMLGTAYATNTEPQVRNRWGQNEEGSVRIMGLTAEKFGTICLPYQAAVACAKIYEIVNGGSWGISLAEHEGLLEAGKPYIYCTTQNTAEDATENKVFFYQATAATVDAPVANNGLIGTFTETTAPKGDNIVVLSNNKLYTVDQDVTVGANKAYIDLSQIENVAEGRVFIGFDEATGIDAAEVAKTLNNGKVYDLQGREVANPVRGLYLVNGKKMIVK